MKDLKRADRRFRTENKFHKRLKKFYNTIYSYFNKDGKLIKHHNYAKFINDPPSWVHVYKNHSTTCSCDMCSPDKYERNKIKEETKDIIKENLEDDIQ